MISILPNGCTEEWFQGLLGPVAAQQVTENEYWIHGWDEGVSFCYRCAVEKVAELNADKKALNAFGVTEFCVDGGDGIGGDSTPFCESCGEMCSNTFTDCGAFEELRHFHENGFDPYSPNDCYCLLNAVSNVSWEACDFENGMPEYKRREAQAARERLHEIVLKVWNDEQKRTGS